MLRTFTITIFALSLDLVISQMGVQPVAYKALETPCCVDHLMTSVCKGLYNRDHARFVKNCRTNPDFSFIQCCHSCHFNNDLFTSDTVPVPSDLYQNDVNELLLRPSDQNCFDRHGTQFCEAFVTRSGIWGRRAYTCQHSTFAFRVCRKTCGYCSSANKTASVTYDTSIAKNSKACVRLF